MSSHKTVYEGQIREQLARDSEHSKILLRRFSAELFDSIQHVLRQQGQLRLHQFGSFKLVWTKERRGRNPQTGESIVIPAHPRIVFTPAKALKQQVNTGWQASPGDTIASTPASIAPTPVTAVNQPEVAPDGTNPQALQNNRAAEPRTGAQFQVLAAAIGAVFIGLLIFYGNMETEQAPMMSTETRQPIQQPASTQPVPRQPAPPQPVESRQTPAADTPSQPKIATTNIKPESAEPAPWFKQRPHTLKDGESLWRLSDKHYINPFYWPHIYQANRKNIHNPNKLIIGRTITLPALQGQPGQLTAADKRHIAEGYFLIYRYYKKNNRPYPYYALLGANKFDPSVIRDHIYEIDEKDWENLQLASN